MTLLITQIIRYETLIGYIKSCPISAGKAEELTKFAKKSGSDGILCDNPSFDIDEYVRLPMMRMN